MIYIYIFGWKTLTGILNTATSEYFLVHSSLCLSILLNWKTSNPWMCFVKFVWSEVKGVKLAVRLIRWSGSAWQTLRAPEIFFLVRCHHRNKQLFNIPIYQSYSDNLQDSVSSYSRKYGLNAWKFLVPFENLHHILLSVPAYSLIVWLLLFPLLLVHLVLDELILSGQIGQSMRWAGEGSSPRVNINTVTLGEEETSFGEEGGLVKSTSSILLGHCQVVSTSPFIMKPLWNL